MVIADFRAAFPEFSSSTTYPDAQITFWSILAEMNTSSDVFGDAYPYAVMLYTAHEITLAANSAKTALVGGTPGQNGGIPTAKAVGDVSVSYDANTTAEKDAGWWNLTVYGKQYFRLVLIYANGAIQL